MKNVFSQFIWSRRQRKIKFYFEFIRAVAEAALPFCLEKPRYPASRLPRVIEITFLNNRAITHVHAQFLQDPTPTDVITFAHSSEIGEILIGIPTVAAQAQQFHQPLEHEIARCIIHGLLHLLDYDDKDEEDRILMHQYQETVLEKALKKIEKK